MMEIDSNGKICILQYLPQFENWCTKSYKNILYSI